MRGKTPTNLYYTRFLFCTPADATFGALKVLELEDTRIVARQVLVRVPGARPERAHPAETLEARLRGDLLRRVDLIRENEVILFFPFAIPPALQPEKGFESVELQGAL
jgi:hypothetical protein